MATKTARLGIVGARGHVGRELLGLLFKHPHFEVTFVSSRAQAGEPVSASVPGAPDGLAFESLSPDDVAARAADAVVLAMPNDLSPPFVRAVYARRADAVVVDLSADHRFDDAWAYGLPELFRSKIAASERIANPGCYATAMALVVAPVADLLDGPARCFGVSGYSGAGTTPSPRNDPEKLRDNLMPYSLVGHVHEREVSRHAGPVNFMPHVAEFFRGISMTVAMTLRAAVSAADLEGIYRATYEGEPLVRVEREIPWVKDAAGRPYATIGGFAAAESERRVVVVSTLDNLLKGAASQALQNLNLAFGFPERMGIDA
jgi:N-acetyl-gamma-glutamyl-phosphate reductase common form